MSGRNAPKYAQDEFISVIARTQAGIDIAQLEAMLNAFWHGVDL